MHSGDIGGVGAGDSGDERASLLQFFEIVALSGLSKPPMQMQLVLRLAAAIDPLASAYHFESGFAQNVLQSLPPRFGVLVQFGGNDKPEKEILLACLPAVGVV